MQRLGLRLGAQLPGGRMEGGMEPWAGDTKCMWVVDINAFSLRIPRGRDEAENKTNTI